MQRRASERAAVGRELGRCERLQQIGRRPPAGDMRQAAMPRLDLERNAAGGARRQRQARQRVAELADVAAGYR
jgi:hypothetical protein